MPRYVVGDNAVVEIKAGTNVQVAASATDNTITISSTDTNTTYTFETNILSNNAFSGSKGSKGAKL